MTLSLQDRAQGALLGLATGDALGTTLEFTQPGSFVPLAGIMGGGPFDLLPGQWTDDTSMALCLAESLVTCGGFDARDQMARYLRWYREGYNSVKGHCFDIGGATAAALRHFEATGDPMAGSPDPQRAGNGSLMRLAPVPIFFHRQPARLLEAAADSSRTTHAARTCVDACRYFASLIAGALHGLPKTELLHPAFEPLPGYWAAQPLCPEVEAIRQGSYRTKMPPDIRGSGYVVDALEAALWALWREPDFARGALAAVNLGDDADTTGAIFGQLAGAVYGLPGIPADWRALIAWGDRILDLADGLLAGPALA